MLFVIKKELNKEVKKIHITTGAIIEKDNKILLVQENKRHLRGLWNFPMGKLEPNLNLIDNLIKEVKEESGLDIKPEGLVGIYQTKGMFGTANVIRFVFKARVIGGNITDQTDKEIIDVKWFTFKEFDQLPDLKLRFLAMRQVIKDYKNGQLFDHKKIIYNNDILDNVIKLGMKMIRDRML